MRTRAHRAVWVGWAVWALAAAGCSSSEKPGVSVELVSLPAHWTGPRMFVADAGVSVRVDAAFWTNSSVEIAACPSASGPLLELLIPTAHAHGVAAPTRSAQPAVQSAAATGETWLGTLTPPASEYCSVSYSMGPADADAVDLDLAPEMLGLSLLVRGAFREPEGSWQGFQLGSAAELTAVTEAFVDLDRSGQRARVEIDRDPGEWWAGIDFSAATPSRVRDAVLLENIQRSLRIQVH
jgi:hypothetical protein